MEPDQQSDLDLRHLALIERDRLIGLEAEAEAARATTARLRVRLEVAQQRLERKNARIEKLVSRITKLEAGASEPARRDLRTRVGGLVARVARRPHAVDEV